MIEILFALGAAITAGLADPMIKRNIENSGRYKAIVYSFIFLSIFLFIGALLLNIKFVFPLEILAPFIAQTIIGAIGIIAYFKAFESGKVSVLGPLSTIYVLLVVIVGIIIFGEQLSITQILGGILVILAGITLAFEDISKFKFEKGVFYIAIAIFSWGYYYSFIKPLIFEIGAYMTTLALETSLTLAISAYYLLKKKDLSFPSKGASGIALRSFIVCLSTIFYSYSIEQIGAALTSIIAATSPLINIPASYLVLKEKLSIYKYAAVVLIVVGLIMILS
ncbi:DMT family transporter [Candidatus Micrarchaeota archaeon]|nr:DMT family transporter [Candidatus Micrarchaeota archaeon]